MKRITTDSLTHTPESFETTVFYKIFAAVASPDTCQQLTSDFTSSKIGWKDAKSQLVDQLVERFGEASETYALLMTDTSKIDEILNKNAAEIRNKAQDTLDAVKRAIGVR